MKNLKATAVKQFTSEVLLIARGISYLVFCMNLPVWDIQIKNRLKCYETASFIFKNIIPLLLI